MNCSHSKLHAQSGFTLSEILVALAINALVITGALTLHQRSGQQYRFVQAAAELDERATFALRALVADTQLAGFFHLPAGSPAAMPVAAACNGNDRTNWAINNANALEIAAPDALPCRTTGSAVTGSAVLIVRHLDPHSDTPVYQAHAWYVDTRSSEPGLPALRRQTLLPDGRMQNQEIMPGVEMLQVRAVVDSDGDGLGDSLLNGPVTGALAVVLELTVRSAGADNIRTHTVRRLVTLRNA